MATRPSASTRSTVQRRWRETPDAAAILVGPPEERGSDGESVPSFALASQSSISATSMWDKSIMCLRSNGSDNSWRGSSHRRRNRRRNTTDTDERRQHANTCGAACVCSAAALMMMLMILIVNYLWKLIWKLAACSGLVNLATAFRCWGISLKVCSKVKVRVEGKWGRGSNWANEVCPQEGVRVVEGSFIGLKV